MGEASPAIPESVAMTHRHCDKGATVYARTSTWSGSPEALKKWTDHAESRVKGFVSGLPGNTGVTFFIDRDSGAALTLTLWDSEEAALASDTFADQSRESTIAATGMELVARGRYEVVVTA
jgi:heme-degrading monooxygenase HmoA